MKTTTRKIIAMILGLALTISILGGASVFAAGSLTVTLTPSAASVNVNDNVVLTGAITGLTGVTDGVVGYTLKITYDAAKFEFVSVTAPATGDFDENHSTAGVVYMVYLDKYTGGVPSPLTAGTIFTATFKAIAAGAADFAVAGIDGTDDFVDTASTVAATYPASATTVTAIAAPAYTLGDINDDAAINSIDSLQALRYSAGLITLTATQLLAGDVNVDAAVNSIDSLQILRYSAGLITTF
jgi:hypothetical protein